MRAHSMTDNQQARAKIVDDYYAEFPKGSASPIAPKNEPAQSPPGSTLHALRGQRKAARNQAVAEALLLSQLTQSKGEKYDAANDFSPELLGIDSVFSGASITQPIARNPSLTEARDYAKTRVNPKSGRQMPAAAQPK
jgi:hypothetical protein